MSTREQAETTPTQTKREDASSPAPRAGYLAFVAHEMRNPLSTALWSAELLARLSPEERGGPRGEKLAGMCLRTLTRLRHLVEDHFLVDRLAIDGIPIRIEVVPLAEAVKAAAGRAGVPCTVAPLDGLSVAADRAMLERAIEALVAAAARGGGPVRVEVDADPAHTAIRFRGAPPEPSALRPPDRSTLSDPSGRALGLLMARAVAESHGGALELAPDGYVFTVPSEDASSAHGER